MKAKSCEVCGCKPCKGWSEGDRLHEYRKGNWAFGCHCPACEKARNESGGFLGLVAALHSEVPK